MSKISEGSYKHYQREELTSTLFDRDLLLRLFKYLKPYHTLIFISLCILIFSKAIEASIPILIGYLSQNILNTGFRDLFVSHLSLDAALIFFLLCLAYGLDSINVWIRSYVGKEATFTLRNAIYAHVLKMPINFFDKNPVGRLMTRTILDVDQIHQMFSESLVPLIGNMFLFICIFIGMFFLNWKVALAVFILLPFVFILTNHFRKVQRNCYDKIRMIVSAMNSFVQENLMGISIIRNFGLERQERKIFAEMNSDHCDAYLKSVDNFSLFVAGIDFFQNLTLILAFAILAYFLSPQEGFQAGAFFSFSLYALMIFRPLADLAERYNVLQAAMAGASRVFAILESDPEQSRDRGTRVLEEIRTVSFEDVYFAYEDENFVLQGLSFTVKIGESVAFVGITGAGKTTVINLLLRFYEVNKGRILINGCDIKDYTLASLRKAFSVVLQDPVLFSGTIAENIALFQPIPKETIERAAAYVNLTSFLQHFPKGLDYSLGERGSGLSAGEMQLVSLARAVAHDRSMVILDEATANIDTATEKLIQDALRKILKNKTALVIAHRLSTIKDAKKIIVISAGKAVEEGTHEELIALKGLYEKLYRLQFTNL